MFGFVYEDSNIEEECIKRYLKKDNINGLMILSGGCIMFDIAKYFSKGQLIATDFNKEQVDLVNTKINLMNDEDKYNSYIDQVNMNFDNLFVRIKNGESFDVVFSNDNLVREFGNDAVLNTKDSFIFLYKNIQL